MRWSIPAVCGLCLLLLAGGSVVYSEVLNGDDCGTGRYVEGASAPPRANNTISFASLNETQRAAFRDALQCNAKFGPSSKWLNVSRMYTSPIEEPFRENEYVRYDGTRYEIVFSQGEFFASYGISASTVTVTEETPVTAFEDVPERIRDEMREALTTGHYSAPPGKWGGLPDPIEPGGYVRYRNQTYKISVVVGDGRIDVMTLDRVD